MHQKGHGRVAFKVDSKFWMDESRLVSPMDYEEFLQVGQLSQFPSGSKVAFRRSMGITRYHYLHTGLLLRGKDCGENAILEACDPGNTNGVVTLHLA